MSEAARSPRSVAPADVTLAGVAAAAILLWPNFAIGCDLAHAVNAGELPPKWKSEIDALVLATHDAAQPWGCGGGEITVVLDEAGATMEVAHEGAVTMTRHVETPEDLVPTGKAMLAAPSVVVAPTIPIEDDWPSEAKPGPVPEVRARIEGSSALRYAGASRVLLAGGALRGSLPFGRWYGALSVRGTSLVAELGTSVPEFEIWEVAMLGTVGYSVLTAPVRLDFGVVGGIALVDMERLTVPATATNEEQEVEGEVVEGALGLELRLAQPLADILNLLVGLDAQVAVGKLADPARRIHPLLPPLPSYTLGLSIGLELGIQ